MKTSKFMAILLILTLSISMLTLTACQSLLDDISDGIDNAVTDANNAMAGETLKGKYVLCSWTDPDGEPFEMEEIKEMLAEDGESIEDTYCFEFFADGSCIMFFEDDGNEGTYKKSGDSVTVCMNDDEAVLPLSGDRLTWNLEGHTLVYEKQ